MSLTELKGNDFMSNNYEVGSKIKVTSDGKDNIRFFPVYVYLKLVGGKHCVL